MTINIRKPEVDRLARRLAAMEGRTISDAVEIALKEAVAKRIASESPTQTAKRLMEELGITPSATAHVPVDPMTYYDFDDPGVTFEPGRKA